MNITYKKCQPVKKCTMHLLSTSNNNKKDKNLIYITLYQDFSSVFPKSPTLSRTSDSLTDHLKIDSINQLLHFEDVLHLHVF